jgi:hypothetical protein
MHFSNSPGPGGPSSGFPKAFKQGRSKSPPTTDRKLDHYESEMLRETRHRAQRAGGNAVSALYRGGPRLLSTQNRHERRKIRADSGLQRCHIWCCCGATERPKCRTQATFLRRSGKEGTAAPPSVDRPERSDQGVVLRRESVIVKAAPHHSDRFRLKAFA